jgi:UDP-N-acetylmuramoyl-L-alanyl-D-glutamate--2,6-diaminopimelate ligase
MQKIKQLIQKVLPKPIYEFLLSKYHFLLSFIGLVVYRHPSRHLTVIGVTGTKGKSSVTEILGHILRTDDKKVATLSTIQFSIGDKAERNLFKMTMPGRLFVQKFLRQAVDAGCTHAVVEMTSEGSKQHRHRCLEIDALIFTNLTPEHIESHGSVANYKQAKLDIARAVVRSHKRPRYLVANVDDEHGADFLDFPVEEKLPYSLSDLSLHTLHKDSLSLVMEEKNLRVPLVGLFNVYNVLAATTMARALGTTLQTIQRALETLPTIAGRVEKFSSPKTAEVQISAVVDYAHTPDSLTKLYEAFPNQPKVCVLGNTGGGRDTWKRPEMAAIAEAHCDYIILTNEDPYDEDPTKIVEEMAAGITNKEKLQIVMDRRTAIETALKKTPDGGVTLISGKGTDPYIMGPNGTKEEWSDSAVVQESMQKIFAPTTAQPDSENH